MDNSQRSRRRRESSENLESEGGKHGGRGKKQTPDGKAPSRGAKRPHRVTVAKTLGISENQAGRFLAILAKNVDLTSQVAAGAITIDAAYADFQAQFGRAKKYPTKATPGAIRERKLRQHHKIIGYLSGIPDLCKGIDSALIVEQGDEEVGLWLTTCANARGAIRAIFKRLGGGQEASRNQSTRFVHWEPIRWRNAK